LDALFDVMLQCEQEWKEAARAKARADLETAQKSPKELETAK
jgi:hypothetical protein